MEREFQFAGLMKWLWTYLMVFSAFGLSAQSAARLASEASLAFEAQNYRRADSLYQKCLEKNPDDFTYRYNAALTKYRIAEWDSALMYFETALFMDSSMQDEVYYNMGDCHLARWQGMVIELEMIGNLITELEPSPELTIEQRLKHFLAKDSLLVLQDDLLEGKVEALDMAIESFKACLRLNPDDEDARYNLLYAYGKKYEPGEEENENDNQEDGEEEKDEKATRVEEVKAKAFEQIKAGDFEGAYRYLSTERERDNDLEKLDPLIEKLGVIVDILKTS